MKKTLILALTLLLPLAQAKTANKEKKKNILVVMVDDLSKELFEDMLRQRLLPSIKTHIIDRGLTFENNFITNPVCCPSRATFLTGQYSMNSGVLDVATGIMYWIDKKSSAYGGENNTIATWVQSAGYYTGHIGKYLNGYGMSTAGVLNTVLHVPAGYDSWFGLIDPSTYSTYDYGMVEKRHTNTNPVAVYYPETSNSTMESSAPGLYQLFKETGESYQVHMPNKYGNSKDVVITENYQTDILANKALEFFDNRNKERPFYLSIMPMAPHVEIRHQDLVNNRNMGYKSHFREKIRPAPRHEYWLDLFPSPLDALKQKSSFNEQDVSDKPKFFKDKDLLDSSDFIAIDSQYKHMMASMLSVDELVEKVAQRLIRDGVYEDTTIIFTSDNGYIFGEHRLSSKVFAYDESARVPLIVAGSKVQGKSCDALVINNDLAPTIADIANAKPQRDVDGRSFYSLLENENSAWDRKQFLIEHYLDMESVMFINDIPMFGPRIIRAGARAMFGDSALLAMLDLPPNDYKAIRRLTEDDDQLYIETYRKKALNRKFEERNTRKAPRPVFIEYYNNTLDPNQVENIVDNKLTKRRKWERGQTGKHLGNLIDRFVKCTGKSCLELENE